ncbi:hypothetical protein Trydic_g13703 [Trypoxylus dichotomus]
MKQTQHSAILKTHTTHDEKQPATEQVIVAGKLYSTNIPPIVVRSCTLASSSIPNMDFYHLPTDVQGCPVGAQVSKDDKSLRYREWFTSICFTNDAPTS